jgi:hypothetical protein
MTRDQLLIECTRLREEMIEVKEKLLKKNEELLTVKAQLLDLVKKHGVTSLFSNKEIVPMINEIKANEKIIKENSEKLGLNYLSVSYRKEAV